MFHLLGYQKVAWKDFSGLIIPDSFLRSNAVSEAVPPVAYLQTDDYIARTNSAISVAVLRVLLA